MHSSASRSLHPTAGISVDVSRRPLTEAEREILLPDVVGRGLAPSMLDVIPPRGRHFQLLRATDDSGRLLGVTSLMSVRPFVSLKQNLGEGNHVGWDTSMYLAERADRARVSAALLHGIAARSFYFGMYFGRIDDDVREALPLIRHRLLETDYELGQISCDDFTDPTDFLARHKRLRRHLRDHARAGGSVHVHEGPVDRATAGRFSQLVHATYRHHGGIGRWQFKQYAHDVCGHHFRTCQDAVHIYSKRNGMITGVQSFVQHRDRLELSEGGFSRSTDNNHAYEAIIAESVAHAVRNQLVAVGYGGIWNAGKDRYCDKENRDKVYLLLLYRSRRHYRFSSDRMSKWAFRTYFGGRFAGAEGTSRIVSRREDI